MADDPGPFDRVRTLLDGRPDVVERRTSGGTACTVGGVLRAGVDGHVDRMTMARIPLDAADAATTGPGTRSATMRGRRMRGRPFSEDRAVESDEALRRRVTTAPSVEV